MEQQPGDPFWDYYAPASTASRPPVLLVPGAANSAWIWAEWAPVLAAAGWPVYALALRGHRGGRPAEVARITMDDYRNDVALAAAHLSEPPVVIGWSMGGLVALMYAATRPDLRALVLLAPSPPLEIQGAGDDESVGRIPDVFGPEVYGIPRAGEPAKGRLAELTEAETARLIELMELESGAARRQRKRGISVPAERVRCPTLVITGARDRQFPPDEGARVAAYYGAEQMVVPGASHLGVVAHAPTARELAGRVITWLEDHCQWR